MKLTNNFNLSEFRSKDGAEFPANVIINIRELATTLQVLRDHLGVSISISSAYRSPAHNAKIGGARNSKHITGMASDIKVRGLTPLQVFNEIELLIRQGRMKQGGLKAYATFVHYDIRGTRARW